jgi:hypothetical protein
VEPADRLGRGVGREDRPALGVGPRPLLDLALERAPDAGQDASADCRVRVRTTTVWPLAAAASAIPVPMIPEPPMPTEQMDMMWMLPTGNEDPS